MSLALNRSWDIDESEVLTADFLVNHTSERSVRNPERSSKAQVFLFVSLSTLGVAGPHSPMMVKSDLAPAAASGAGVILGKPLSVRRSEMKGGLDYARSRSHEKLAKGFEAYFQPSSRFDESDDDGYIFR